jgi:hypothetical protein
LRRSADARRPLFDTGYSFSRRSEIASISLRAEPRDAPGVSRASTCMPSWSRRSCWLGWLPMRPIGVYASIGSGKKANPCGNTPTIV